MSNKRSLLILLLAAIAQTTFSQTARTPFSSFGVGEYYGNALAHSQGMAGVGISNPQYWYLNNLNPALLVFNNFTTFEGGMVGERRKVRNDSGSEVNGNGNMNYLILGFPIVRGKWSNSIGLTPYSTVNYKFSYSDAIDGSANTVRVTEEGTGGINQVAWSHGLSLHRYLSVGVKASYLFSSIKNSYSNTLEQTDQSLIYIPSVSQRYYFSDFNFTGGVSFHKDSLFQRNYRLNIGAVYELKTSMKTELQERLERFSVQGTDSITLNNNVVGQTTLPSSLSVGVSFGRADRWVIGVDGYLADFAEFKNFENRPISTHKARRLAVGGEFTPDPASLSNYLKRMTYRTGVSLEEYPYLINGKPLKDFGINFGFSLPVSRISSVDLAFRWGKRGGISENTIEENYFKIYFGVTFNDQWFIKRRFD